MMKLLFAIGGMGFNIHSCWLLCIPLSDPLLLQLPLLRKTRSLCASKGAGLGGQKAKRDAASAVVKWEGQSWKIHLHSALEHQLEVPV